MKLLRYAHLSESDLPRLHRAFLEAFSDYEIDMRSVTERQLGNRWTKNGVSYESSAAAFDGDRMVAFLVVGLDDWKGRPAAFDAGTGIVRGYRGFGVAPALFDLAVTGLRARGVESFVLEVLQTNRPAVMTYRRIGFSIARQLDCLLLPADRPRPPVPPAPGGLVVEAVGRDLLPLVAAFGDWPPSWETSFASLARIPDDLVLRGARFGDRWVGFAAWYPGLGWLMDVVVERTHRRRGVARHLLARVLGELPPSQAVKVVNVDHSDEATLALLGQAGFEVYARQHEMELDLRAR